MKGYLKHVSPVGGLRDFWNQLRAPQPHRLRFILAAGAITGGMFYLMIGQHWSGLPKPPQVTYFPSLAEGRSDKQIVRDNIAATKKANAEKAQDEADDAEIRNRYKAVGDYFGMDTKTPSQQGDAERAAAAKAEAARIAQILKTNVVHH
ncbi:hypothetical protein [Novosphingobium lentum]|uniref:hypothetical protein n=1 Tax=Novosphingobium lentum TaxID=145287 RepID=UPI00082EE573|nr:hypothetical protein [Novosphingobium lentum]